MTWGVEVYVGVCLTRLGYVGECSDTLVNVGHVVKCFGYIGECFGYIW